MIVIFSGYNQRAVITFIRTLEKSNIEYAIIAKSKEDDIFRTKYKKNVFAFRQKIELDLDDIKYCLNQIKKLYPNKKFLIAPSTEALNRFLLEQKSVFENENCIIPLVEKELYEKISDKYGFSNLCKEYFIKCPKELDFKKENIPLVVKPINYVASNGKIYSPKLVLSENDFYNVEKSIGKNFKDFYYQEYLDGESYYLLYYFSKNGEIIKLSQQNLIQQDGGKSIIASIPSTIHNEKISTIFEKMFLQIGFYGLIMIELRKNNNEYYMIEANPRFWGPSQLFCDYGLNLFEYFLQDNGFNIEIKNEKNEDIKYFWNGGLDGTSKYLNSVLEYDLNTFFEYEIYNREDTQEIFQKEIIEKLVNEYSNLSKHSNYQILASELAKYIPQNNLEIKSRAEFARLKYILEKININGKNITDIGANTGYFTFEFLKNGAESVTCYEGNSAHAQFIQDSSLLMNYNKKLRVYNEYFSFDKLGLNFDIMLLLNVLHHVGDDYGERSLQIENAKEKIIYDLNTMACRTKTLVFQLGFNWKGNRNYCLFKNGTKSELINYIKEGVRNYWEIIDIGIAEKHNNEIIYKDLDSNNIKRDDTLGEFLNRPLFIMKSKVM